MIARRLVLLVTLLAAAVASTDLSAQDATDWNSLTDAQRDVIMLRVVADLSIADVAEILGVRRGAVKALQHRAITALRKHLRGAFVSQADARAFTSTT